MMFFSFLSLLHFTNDSRRLGPLVMIFEQMMVDLLRFILLWFVVFLGFSQAMYLQMKAAGQAEFEETGEESGLADWRQAQGSLLWIFRWSMGGAEFGRFSLLFLCMGMYLWGW